MSNKITRNPLFHISKRVDVPLWQAWLIRAVTIVVAILFCGIVTAFLKEDGFSEFFKYLFEGTFGNDRRILILFQNMAMLLIVSLAVTPAFKMKFWNIGAEGQVLMGALLAAVVMYFFGPNINNNGAVVIIMMIFAILAGIAWAVIPAIFKAQWNANETLFTLMMNYIAARLVSFTINKVVTNGSGKMGIINATTQLGWLPKVGGYDYIINIILVLVLTVLLAVYLRFSKHGYELTVVGESINTAKYIGVNVKKVIIRTMILSGALCGMAGFFLVSGSSHTIDSSLAGGRGFTAILVSWLSQFNPAVMVIMSFLVVFIDQGSSEVASLLRLGTSFSDMVAGIFFFFLIACEFFINYKIKFNSKKGIKIKKEETVEPTGTSAISLTDITEDEESTETEDSEEKIDNKEESQEESQTDDSESETSLASEENSEEEV